MRGDPGSGRPIQCVTKYEPQRLLCLVFTIYPPIPTEVTSPPEPNDNAKLRRHPKPQRHSKPQRHHHLSSISLASKHDLEVDFSMVSTPLPPLPPPSHPNASRRWTFLAFQHVWHHHHPLASKCEPEVDFSAVSKLLPSLPPPSRSNASQR